MKITNRTLISAALVAGSALALAPTANATPALAISGAFGSSCGTASAATSTDGTIAFATVVPGVGTFSITGFGVPVSGPPQLLDSQTLDALMSGPGTVTLCVTETGLSGPVMEDLLSSFTTNILSGETLTLTTFGDPGDAAYGTTDTLYTHSWTTPVVNGTADSQTPFAAPGQYSITEQFTLTSASTCTKTHPCTTNDTIDTAQVPEPATLAILAGGMLAGAFAVRRRRRA